MPKTIPLIEKRKWLGLYEAGKSEASIAANAKRDIKTIKRGIEEARDERRIDIVKTELLRGAIRTHQDQLIAAIGQISSALKVPEIDAKPELPAKCEGYAVVYSLQKELEVVLDIEGSPQWELLHEHFKRDKIWNLITKWNTTLLNHVEAKLALKKKVEAKLSYCKFWGIDEAENPESESNIYFRNTRNFIYHYILNNAFNLIEGIKPVDQIHIKTNGIFSAEGVILARVPDQAEEFKYYILGMVDAHKFAVEVERIKTTYTELSDLTEKLQREAEEKLLVGLIPGHCRVCSKLGL